MKSRYFVLFKKGGKSGPRGITILEQNVSALKAAEALIAAGDLAGLEITEGTTNDMVILKTDKAISPGPPAAMGKPLERGTYGFCEVLSRCCSIPSPR